MPYHNCKWCNGSGCITCEIERKKDIDKLPEPLFVLKNERDWDLLDGAIGAEAINKAFGPEPDPMKRFVTGEGGGLKTIEHNLAIASLLQHLRDERKEQEKLNSTNAKGGDEHGNT